MIKKLLYKNTLSLGVLFFSCSVVLAQGSWKQKGASINGSSAGDNFGATISFAASGNTYAAAAVNNGSGGSMRGQVKVFTLSGSTWIQKGANLVGDANGDFFGRSVSLDSAGNTIAIGGPYNDAGQGSLSTSGHVKIYSWSGSAWTQKGSTLLADSAGENFGYSVSISYDGNTVAVGIPFSSGTLGVSKGRVKIYRWISNSWTQIGGNINGANMYDNLGSAVSLSANGNIVAIGAPGNSDGGSQAGKVSIFSYNGTTWSQLGSGIDGDTNDYSGTALSLSADGKRVAIGSPQDIINGGYGVARVYEWNNTAWVQLGSSLVSPYFYDQFGNAISLSGNGNRMAVGAATNVTGNEAGRTQIFNWSGSVWQQLGDSLRGDSIGDQAGTAVSLSYTGNLVAIGATMNNGNGLYSGRVKAFGYCTHSSSSINITSCNGSYNSPSGKYTWTTNGIYKDTIPNSGGCDSIITINLTIGTALVVNLGADISRCANLGSVTLDAGNPGSAFLWSNNDTTKTISVNTTGTYFVKVTKNGCSGYDTIQVTIKTVNTGITLNGAMVTSDENGATYRWLDCNNTQAPISGATQKAYTFIGCYGSSTNVAVEVTKDGCVDTSACNNINLNWATMSQTVTGPSNEPNFGKSVALSGDGLTMAVASPGNNKVRVYSWDGTVWNQKGGDLTGKFSANDKFGISMALSADGKVIIIGDPGDVASPSFNDTSYVAVYAWNGTSWTPRKVSKKGFAAKDNFGCSVAISADGGVINIGAASAASSFYSNTLLYWNAATSSYEPTTTYMFTEAPGLQDRTPVTLAADGKTFAIGLIRYNKPWPSPLAQAGAIYVKKQGSNPTSWNGMSRFIYGTSTNDLLGYQICLSHDGSKLVAVSKSATDPAVYTYYLYDTGYVNTGAVIHADVYSASLSDDGMKLVTCNNTGVCTYYEWVNENWQVKNNSITLSRTPELGYRNISSINANGKRFATISGNTSNFSATSYTWCNGTYMGVEEPEERGVELASITVYPNPNNGAFTIKATNGQQINTVEVYNAMGQLVHTSVLEGNTTETNIELQNQPMGIYFVKVSANNTHETLRIMLKR